MGNLLDTLRAYVQCGCNQVEAARLLFVHLNTWYFRNALVRANYEDVTRGIAPKMRYLALFFENLLSGKRHELKNRYLHIDWESQQGTTQETTQEKAETT